MPFKDDSPFEKRTRESDMDLENGKEIQKPLLESQDEPRTGGQDVVDDDGIEGEEVDLPPEHMVKHVHFSQSLQRALEEKEWDEEHGLNKDDDDEEGDLMEDTREFWEWVKAETKCYANYICPVVLVNACILLLVIVYFYTQKN